MPGIHITYDPTLDYTMDQDDKEISGSKYKIVSNRGISASSSYIPIIIDNTRFGVEDYEYVLNTPAFDIEFVQILKPWQALAYTYGALDGAILVKTRSYKERPPLPSKGAMYSPMGLSPFSYPFKEYTPEPWKAEKVGTYRLKVDVISDTEVKSYEHLFEVIE